MTDPARNDSRFEEIKVKGNQLVAKVREIIEEGNARRIIIKKEDRVLLEFPMSVGMGGAAAALLLAPTLAAVGALAALVTDVKIIIERADVPATWKEAPPVVEPPPESSV
ncbi:MAG TPA: DUF4342 domain-containing protein [Rhodothermales bacterium]|nr:DUF4342 domain-containing protein [Rhodothermales bacterium]